MGSIIDDPAGASSPDPFGGKARRTHLETAEEQLDSEAYQKLVDAEADQRARGVAAVGFHPVCGEVVEMPRRLIDAALEFDEEAKDYELKQLEVHGSCQNPFSESREAESFKFISRKIDGIPGRILSMPIGKRLWSGFDQKHWGDLLRIEKQRVQRRLKLAYQKRRAAFELDAQAIRARLQQNAQSEVLIAGGQVPERPDAKRGGTKALKEAAPKRSWTQPDLDDAIREYKAKRAGPYSDLVEGVRRKQPGAMKSARELFGRNAIVRALGVRSPAMVSKSAVWQQIADDLGLRGRVKKGRRPEGQRIAMGIALEEAAVAAGDTAVDQAIRRETVRLIERAMPAKGNRSHPGTHFR